MNTNVPITSTGILIASVGVAVGTIAGALLRPTVEKILRRKPKSTPLEDAMKNPVVVEVVEDSPIYDAEKKKHETDD